MSIKSILIATYQTLLKWPKPRLIKALESLKTKHIELEAQVNKLKEENAKLKQKLEQEKIQATNKQVNKPSSKQAEWEKGCSKGKDKSKKKRKRRKPRKGAGNCPKNKEPNGTKTATVENCDLCGKDLSDKAPLESCNNRIIEDIPDLPEETVITLVKQEKKYCDECQEVITAKSDLALPKADIGLNATVLLCYLNAGGIAVLADGWDQTRNISSTAANRRLAVYWHKHALPSADKAIQSMPAKPKTSQFQGLSNLFPFIKQATPLQEYAINEPLNDKPQLFILEDVTGAGKTEAALILTHRFLSAGLADGLYVALPTMATANAMYKRLGKVYRRFYESRDLPSLILAHGARELSDSFRESVFISEDQAADLNHTDGYDEQQELKVPAF
ncbi:MAG: hypothetical protein SRB2_01888 [Desulfobacteraceae bacterium Eth-SRB2]|nr:MAG: hypothetical protein SRB2_01888 [Desulfobacteraceae bacterium Eth-SRB2]